MLAVEKCHIDFETASRTDLVRAGSYRYCEDPSTRAWGFSWRIGHGQVSWWRPGDPAPLPLLEHITAGRTVVSHNAAFERGVWNEVLLMLPECWTWPRLVIEQQDCTMARASAISYPHALEVLCEALNTVNRKDMQGSGLMMQMCKPRGFNPDGSIIWWDDEPRQQRLAQYGIMDTVVETEVDDVVPPLTPYERKVWELDQRINDRGVPIDVVAVQKCVTLVELAKKAADSEMRRLTDRTVPKCSNDNKIIAWVNGRGIECTTVKKSVQEDIIFFAGLNNDPLVKDVVNLRADSKKTSTAKYKKMTEAVCADGRLRGQYRYHGAGPGRWAAQGVQLQNFPRVDYKKEGHTFRWIAEMLHTDMPVPEVFDMLTSVYGLTGDSAPLRLLSRGLRSVIQTRKGKKLVGGDFSNIEGRFNAWFAGEHWKLKAFADQDSGAGRELYKLTASSILGKVYEDITDDERQALGKVPELSLGYQGGVGAFINMGVNYGVNPYDLPGPVIRTVSREQWDNTAARYESAKDKCGLMEREWTAIKIIVENWRKANPAIVQSWWDVQDAALEAVALPHHVFTVLDGKISYYSDERCLWCVLPSGRMICYAEPRIVETLVEYVDKYTGETKERFRRSVRYMDYKERQWREEGLYGGLQCENYTQGTARDAMVHTMFIAEEHDYPIIFHCHDELLAEVDDNDTKNRKDFEALMGRKAPWCADIPLTAKAWEDTSYVK